MLRYKKRFLLLAFFLVLIIVVSVFVAKRVMGADIASNIVATSTSSTATQNSNQRKTFYDSVNSLYWVFYNNGSAIAYSYSSNGTSWSSGGTTGVATSDFSLWYVAGTSTVYLVYPNSGLQVEKGTLSSSSISWTSNTPDSTSADEQVGIARDSNGNIWLTWYNGANQAASYIYGIKSVNADNITSWNTKVSVGHGSGSPIFGTVSGPTAVVPLTTSGDMFVCYYGNTQTPATECLRWVNGSSSFTDYSLGTGNSSYFSIVSMSSDIVHMFANGIITSGPGYAKFASNAWSTPINIDSNTTDTDLTLTENGTDLYAFYIRSNTIYYRKGVSPYAAGNWGAETPLVSTGTNAYLNSAYTNSNGYAIITWTEGTGSPWNVRFYGFSLGGATPPTKIVFTNAARTLTAGACNGAAGVFTMQLQDNGGTPQNPTQTTVVQVTSNSSSYTIYSDLTCTTPVSGGNFTYTTSDNTKSVYIIDNKKSISTSTLTGTRTSGDTLTTGTQNYTVNAGSVTQLVITLPGQTFADGSGNSGTVLPESSGVVFPIQLHATDSNFNLNTSYTGDKTLVFSGPSVGYLNPTVTDKNGTNQNYGSNTVITFSNGAVAALTTLYKAETTTITATDGGNYGLASASLTITSSTTLINGGTIIKGGTKL
jgi:hypothetical protein